MKQFRLVRFAEMKIERARRVFICPMGRPYERGNNPCREHPPEKPSSTNHGCEKAAPAGVVNASTLTTFVLAVAIRLDLTDRIRKLLAPRGYLRPAIDRITHDDSKLVQLVA